jgi:exodeoxyribonuclease III
MMLAPKESRPMKIATWNVNSLNVRLAHLLQWLEQARPDVLVLQETKLEDHKFPVEPIREAGYHCAFIGQKTYNGVAILAREAIQDVEWAIPGLDDPAQRRVLAATISGVRVINLYVVNGQAVGSDKYDFKLSWLERVRRYVAEQMQRFPACVVLGDFNITPTDLDVHDPVAWKDQILCSAPEREALNALLDLGLHDSFRLKWPEAGHFSWWDYRQAGYRRNLGLRIDLVLISEALKGKFVDGGIDKAPRELERPSDHAPAWVELDLAP